MKIYIICGLLGVAFIQSAEFIYPVAQTPDSSIYLIYQKTPHHIELWEWDYHTHYTQQILLSRFTPAGLRMMPGGKGFSFIDNGLIKIKQFIKRSPRTLDLDAPIHNIEVVTWMDDEYCYTSGQYRDKIGIFQIDYEGMVYPVRLSKSHDCMYPQKCGDKLFYIERDEYQQYCIKQTGYEPVGILQSEFSERIKEYWDGEREEEVVFDFGLKPLAFLHMLSPQEGFVLSYPKAVSKKDVVIPFLCYHVLRQEGIWIVSLLFTFSIPTSLIFIGSEARLYEALLPLLPLYKEGQIFYGDSEGSGTTLNIFSYQMASKEIKKISFAHGTEQFFGLFQCYDHVLYGGRLCDNPDVCIAPKDRLSMALVDGGVQVKLGKISL